MTRSGDSLLISVLMAEYNTSPDRLRKAMASILAQTERRFEFLIVDDGSATDVRSIAAEFADDRIRVVGYGENRGFVAALNYGLDQARGEYIARMDTDDTVEPDYLEAVYGWISQHPEYAVVSGQAREISSDGPGIVLGRPGEQTARLAMRGFTPIHAASIMRASAVKAAGGYQSYKRAEDLALWYELLLRGYRLYVIPKVVYNYRVEKADFAKRSLRHRRDEIRVRVRYYPQLGAGPREYARIAKSVLSGLLPVSAVRAIRGRLHPRG
ncbi:glycosyltransferase [Microbacterium sp. Au-Mic1]|uniref:glycosyltransferase n=1 Tax=Microbacterium sp. Au-Mic1 TaxID=2906457 RepID=UPI001E64BC33|nr:glycosyltransferase [Microbacterium sp. Au-Mic1]MCE4027325.1 glycosyltransferase [Microbacterium sp. Au-Mic1]